MPAASPATPPPRMTSGVVTSVAPAAEAPDVVRIRRLHMRVPPCLQAQAGRRCKGTRAPRAARWPRVIRTRVAARRHVCHCFAVAFRQESGKEQQLRPRHDDHEGGDIHEVKRGKHARATSVPGSSHSETESERHRCDQDVQVVAADAPSAASERDVHEDVVGEAPEHGTSHHSGSHSNRSGSMRAKCGKICRAPRAQDRRQVERRRRAAAERVTTWTTTLPFLRMWKGPRTTRTR